ncbi:hypothetical protein RUND412_007132, partial [Rhizina undulata]
MSSLIANLIPLPEDSEGWKERLFYLPEPVEVPEPVFDKIWPQISSVYTFYNRKLTAKEQTEEHRIKCPHSSIREKDQCAVEVEYLVPCCHIFHLDTAMKVFTPVLWQNHANMFEELGLAV